MAVANERTRWTTFQVIAENLRDEVMPYFFLRRTKANVAQEVSTQ
jgi:hypothetical protein